MEVQEGGRQGGGNELLNHITWVMVTLRDKVI